MEVKLLKQLRRESWSRYEVRSWDHVAGCQDRPWHICSGPHSALGYHEYRTREEAIKAAKLLWHEVAERYLWDNRDKRKRNKYPY